MSVFAANMRHKSFYWQISMLCFVLGAILAAAVYTSNKIAHSEFRPNRAGFDYNWAEAQGKKKVVADSEEITKLREDKKQLENAIASGDAGKKLLNASLQEARIYAGLTEVTGPGVTIWLQDSKKSQGIGMIPESYLIHDRDINEVINELRSAGAEAIAVADQRVVNSTALRCVGPVLMVNAVPEGAPFVVKAIGNPETLLSALNLTNGVLDGVRRYDPLMARAEKSVNLRLPAYTGNTQMKYARPVMANNSDKSQSQ